MSILRSATTMGSVDSSLRPKDISNEILKVRPDKKKVLTMLAAMGKVTVDDYEFQNNQQGIDPGSVTILTVNAGAKTVTVSADDLKAVRVDQTWRLSHAFAYRVTAVNRDTNTVTLSTATGLNADGGDIIALGATSFGENSSRPTAIQRVPTVGTNYVATLRDATGQSRHSRNVKFMGGPRAFHNREAMIYEHGRMIDRELIFGEKEKGTDAAGNVLYRTGGLLYQIQSNIREFTNGRLSYFKAIDLVAADSRLTQSDTFWCLCSDKGMALWTKLAYDKHIPTDIKEVFGINVMKIQLGSKFLKLYPVDHLNDSAELENTQILVDPAFVEIVTTQDQETKQRQWMLEKKVEGRDVDGTDNTNTEVLTDFGLRLENEAAHAIWWNVDDITL